MYNSDGRRMVVYLVENVIELEYLYYIELVEYVF